MGSLCGELNSPIQNVHHEGKRARTNAKTAKREAYFAGFDVQQRLFEIARNGGGTIVARRAQS